MRVCNACVQRVLAVTTFASPSKPATTISKPKHRRAPLCIFSFRRRRRPDLEFACYPMLAAEYGEPAAAVIREEGLMANPMRLVVNAKWDQMINRESTEPPRGACGRAALCLDALTCTR
jgi:hypothetical protein